MLVTLHALWLAGSGQVRRRKVWGGSALVSCRSSTALGSPHLMPRRRSASAHSRARSATWRQLLTCTLRSSTPTLTTA